MNEWRRGGLHRVLRALATTAAAPGLPCARPCVAARLEHRHSLGTTLDDVLAPAADFMAPGTHAAGPGHPDGERLSSVRLGEARLEPVRYCRVNDKRTLFPPRALCLYVD